MKKEAPQVFIRLCFFVWKKKHILMGQILSFLRELSKHILIYHIDLDKVIHLDIIMC